MKCLNSQNFVISNFPAKNVQKRDTHCEQRGTYDDQLVQFASCHSISSLFCQEFFRRFCFFSVFCQIFVEFQSSSRRIFIDFSTNFLGSFIEVSHLSQSKPILRHHLPFFRMQTCLHEVVLTVSTEADTSTAERHDPSDRVQLSRRWLTVKRGNELVWRVRDERWSWNRGPLHRWWWTAASSEKLVHHLFTVSLFDTEMYFAGEMIDVYTYRGDDESYRAKWQCWLESRV